MTYTSNGGGMKRLDLTGERYGKLVVTDTGHGHGGDRGTEIVLRTATVAAVVHDAGQQEPTF